jgi:hypothetical protein
VNAYIVAGVTLVTIHFGVLVVVALAPHEPGKQGRHLRDQLMGLQ